MTKAIKDHWCTLCHRVICTGTNYINETIKPWDHIENECFGVYKAHLECHNIWGKVGDDQDWIFPGNNTEWTELTGRSKSGVGE